MWQNETKRHFKLRNLEKDMQQAASEIRPISERERKAMTAGTPFMLAVLIVLCAILAFVFGIV